MGICPCGWIGLQAYCFVSFLKREANTVAKWRDRVPGAGPMRTCAGLASSWELSAELVKFSTKPRDKELTAPLSVPSDVILEPFLAPGQGALRLGWKSPCGIVKSLSGSKMSLGVQHPSTTELQACSPLASQGRARGSWKSSHSPTRASRGGCRTHKGRGLSAPSSRPPCLSASGHLVHTPHLPSVSPARARRLPKSAPIWRGKGQLWPCSRVT